MSAWHQGVDPTVRERKARWSTGPMMDDMKAKSGWKPSAEQRKRCKNCVYWLKVNAGTLAYCATIELIGISNGIRDSEDGLCKCYLPKGGKKKCRVKKTGQAGIRRYQLEDTD